MCQSYIEHATALSDYDEQITIFIDLCFATFCVLMITGKLSWSWNLLLLAGVCQSRALRQPVCRKSRASFVLKGWNSLRQPYIESATTLSDTVFPPVSLFPSRPYSTRPVNEAGFYTGPASIYAHSSCSSFCRVLFYAVYSSKLESDIVALSLEHWRPV